MDYLPVLYQYETQITSAPPRPIASYETLWYPFDSLTWAFVLGSSIAIFVLLLLIDQLWWLETGEHTSANFFFEGKIFLPLNFWKAFT